MSDPHRDLREQLEAIAEDLGDRALTCLREAMAAEAEAHEPDDFHDDDHDGSGDGAPRPRRRATRRSAHPAADEERRLTRARRAVEKAAALLEPTSPGTDDA